MRLSVIVPGYNTPKKFWDRCIASVLGNLQDDDELICVDDASTLDTSFLQEWADKDGRIKYVKQPVNRGQAYARNVGIEMARGELVAFVDSDDELFEGIYDKCRRLMEARNADVVVYGVRNIWVEEGLYKDAQVKDEERGILTSKRLLRLYKGWLFNYPWNKLYRRSFLDMHKIRFVETAIPREDEVLNLACVDNGARWSVVEDIGHRYYRYDGTSLARYRRCQEQADQAVNDAWSRALARLDNAAVLEDGGILSAAQMRQNVWRNMWRRGAPYTLGDRIGWAKRNFGSGWLKATVKMLLFMFVRKYLYIRPLRRWNIRHLTNNVKEYR